MTATVAYPFLVEPNLTLAAQRAAWAAGYGVLAVLIAVPVLLWRAPPRKDEVGRMKDEQERQKYGSSFILHPSSFRWVCWPSSPPAFCSASPHTFTTDVTAHPLLWMPPLALYLLSFVLVFSPIPGRVARMLPRGLRDGRRFWAFALPLLVLLLLYLVLSGAPLGIGWVLGLHLTVFFTACMVCHGELARDRPGPERLTEFFLWLSVGGALGGLFNALVAPRVFPDVVEYPLALWLACLLLPTLAAKVEGVWSFRVEVGLVAVFTLLGLLLVGLRLADRSLNAAGLAGGRWGWHVAALLAAAAAGAVYVLRRPDGRPARTLDFLLPLALGVLVVGLILGVSSAPVYGTLSRVSGGQDPLTLQKLLAFGLPAVPCFTLVDRPCASAWASAPSCWRPAFRGLFDAAALYQTRSFYGVLQVRRTREGGRDYYCLYHGTTLHGQQAADGPDRANRWPTTTAAAPPARSSPRTTSAPREPRGDRSRAGTLQSTPGPPEPHLLRDRPERGRPVPPRRLFHLLGRRRGPRRPPAARPRRRPAHAGKGRPITKGEIPNPRRGRFQLRRDPDAPHRPRGAGIYLDRLADGGVIAFHISNIHIDLRPVLANLAGDAGLAGLCEDNGAGDTPGKAASTWVVLARKREDLKPLSDGPAWRELRPDPAVGVWTDDYSNLFGVLRRGK